MATYKYYIFTDTVQHKNYGFYAETENEAWAQVCDTLGTEYVFKAVKLTA